MDLKQVIAQHEIDDAANVQFFKTPRKVKPLSEQEPFNFWGNVVEFYGMEKIHEFFVNMFRKEEFNKRPTSLPSHINPGDIKMVNEILRD